MIGKWTNIKSVLFELERFIPKDLYSEARLINDCMRAVDAIGAVPATDRGIAFIPVKHHKFCLPLDCLQIIQIAHRATPILHNSDLDDLREVLGLTDQAFIEYSNLPFNVWFDSWSVKRGWKPLRLSTDSFALSVHCEHSRSLGDGCEGTYTVQPDGTCTTSMEDAIVLVSYYKYATDCDGQYLIPDDEDYKEALRDYCLMNAWEYRWNTKEEGAGERYLKYQQLWGLYKGKATASIRMPDLNETENLNQIITKLIPNKNRFQNFFKNIATPEDLDFKGFSSHYMYR